MPAEEGCDHYRPILRRCTGRSRRQAGPQPNELSEMQTTPPGPAEIGNIHGERSDLLRRHSPGGSRKPGNPSGFVYGRKAIRPEGPVQMDG